MSGSQKITIPIAGMSCQHCVMSVKNRLESMPGVEAVNVTLEPGQAEITGSNLDVAALRQAIDDIGFEAGE